MGYPRARLVDITSPGYYHCISRCVRRGFLCGDQYDHRRQWIEQRLAELLEVFAIDAFTLSTWVKNALDDDYVAFAFDNLPHASRAVQWGEPRTWGLDLKYEY